MSVFAAYCEGITSVSQGQPTIIFKILIKYPWIFVSLNSFTANCHSNIAVPSSLLSYVYLYFYILY